MKTKTFIHLSAIVIAMVITSNLTAQPANREGFKEKGVYKFLPDVTENQEAQIKELKTKHWNEIKILKNELNEKQAKQQTLMTADEPDMNAINKNIDEITALKNKLMKANAAHQQEIRKLLTPEQKAAFDMHMMNKGQKGKAKGHQGQGGKCK